MIHFTWHLVSYSHITLKLGAKASLEIANHVRNNFFGAILSQQNNYPNPQTAFRRFAQREALGIVNFVRLFKATEAQGFWEKYELRLPCTPKLLGAG